MLITVSNLSMCCALLAPPFHTHQVIEKAYKKLRLDALVIQQGRLTENTQAKVRPPFFCSCPFTCVLLVSLPLFVCAVGVCVAATDGEHPGQGASALF